jgi:hypothetical protein
MVSYGQPRRLNAFTVTLLILFLAGGYWLWRFFPAYFDAWTVDHVLKEAATSVYNVSRMREPERTQRLKEIADKARADAIKLGHVTDPDLNVELNLDGDKATVRAEYQVIVTHPYIHRTTTLRFVRTAQSNVKRVDWE